MKKIQENYKKSNKNFKKIVINSKTYKKNKLDKNKSNGKKK